MVLEVDDHRFSARLVFIVTPSFSTWAQGSCHIAGLNHVVVLQAVMTKNVYND